MTPMSATAGTGVRRPSRWWIWTAWPRRRRAGGRVLRRGGGGGLGVSLVAGTFALGTGTGRRLAGLGVLRPVAGTAVGAVETRALEYDADRGEDLKQPPAADRAHRQRVIAELLHHLELLVAFRAGILIRGHRFSLRAKPAPPGARRTGGKMCARRAMLALMAGTHATRVLMLTHCITVFECSQFPWTAAPPWGPDGRAAPRAPG